MTRRVAILIASSRFPDEPGLAELQAPERDIDGLAGILAQESGGVYDEVIPLKNEPSQKVRVRLNRVLRAATKDDQVLIYYSGHGKLDPTGSLCLTMTDTMLDALESSSVRIGEIKDFIAVSKCKQVMLFLDCCYSGAVGKSFARSSVDDQLQIVAEKGSGICIMSASNAVQTAMETAESGLGVFTRHVIEGVRSGAADVDGDGVVTFDELYDYVRRQVVADGHQRPQKWSFQAEGELLVARTGKDRWEDVRVKSRSKVLALAASGDLPDEIVAAALSLLKVPRKEHSRKQSMLAALLTELAEDRARVGEFVLAWTKSTHAPDEQAPAAPEPQADTRLPPDPVPAEAPREPAAASLDTWPKDAIDFGRRTLGEHAQEQFKIWRNGPGPLQWTEETDGDFFEVDRNAEGLLVTLVGDMPGKQKGRIRVRSNCGDAEIEVRVRIVAPRTPAPVPGPQQPVQPLHPAAAPPGVTPGRWVIEVTAIGFVKSTFTLDLDPSGNFTGTNSMWGMHARNAGTWFYDPVARRLMIQIVTEAFGTHSMDSVAIEITGAENATLVGRDGMMRSYKLMRMA